MGRALEQPRFNPVDEKVYQVSNSDDVIHQIDPSSDRLLNTFAIGDNCNANGLAINPNTNQALLGSDNDDDPHTLLWDLATQRPLARYTDSSSPLPGSLTDPSSASSAATPLPSGPTSPQHRPLAGWLSTGPTGVSTRRL